ncbi:MAG: hypothetical protein ACKOFL_02305 [Actinomycetota bacterium]
MFLANNVSKNGGAIFAIQRE